MSTGTDNYFITRFMDDKANTSYLDMVVAYLRYCLNLNSCGWRSMFNDKNTEIAQKT